jgi:hypothetical protein
MPEKDIVQGDRQLPDRRLPLAPCRGRLDLAGDEVDDAVQDLVLVGDVAVQRHRLDTEILAEPAHAQALDAALVRQRDRGAQHALSVQGRSRLPRHRLDKLTLYV